ncbi:MAG: class I SAM-dependent methyltransferase [Longimicrobiales bacterium]|nr:class I SAM-dependent methyltransferase [Longimicrobiales bacterium]
MSEAVDARLQLRIQRYGWDAAASVYQDAWQAQLAPAQEALLACAHLRAGQRVIETAAGTGLVTFAAAAAVGPDGHVLATDLSGEMVASGRAEAGRRGLDQVTFQRMNAEALDCADRSFERALCSLGLMYMPDPVAALGELKRTLVPGGRAAVSVWGERRNCGWAEIFPIVDARVASEVCPLFFSLGAPDALASAMLAAGFRDVEERRLQEVMTFSGPRQILEAVIDGGAVALAARRFEADTRRAVDREFLDSVAAWREGERYRVPGEFVVATGVA